MGVINERSPPIARSHPPMPATLSPGDPAPPLELPDLDGTLTSLRDLQGRPVLVSFLRHAG
jgi:peroxiredoxin